MTTSETKAVNNLLIWALARASGRPAISRDGVVITDAMASEAAGLLTATAGKD